MTDDARPCWGLLGGAFDPPHLGHLAVGALALAAGGLERLLVVPCFEHPFAKRMTPWEDRLAMTRLAFAHLARVEVSPIESGLPRPSLTLHTLEALRTAHPDVKWRLVIGSDTQAERTSWYRFEEVMRLAEPLVIGRCGHGAGDLDFVVPDVSSTEIRRRLAAGEDARGWLDPAVLAYVQAHRLYGAGPGEPRP
jgi:nicotinate-nucleotide adenylyltransferase